MNFLISMLLSLLPLRYRRRIRAYSEEDYGRGAFWSGLLTALICLSIWVVRFLWFVQYRTGTLSEGLIKAGQPEAMGSEHVAFGAGLVTWFEYVLQPMSLLLFYFIVEGVVRYIAAYIHNEAIPTVPLQLVAWIDEWFAHRRHEKWLGEKIADEVLRGSGQDFEYRISSCRPKAWGPLMTISYQEGLFEVFKEEEGPPPRRFIYLLRKAPANKVVRGLHNYDPQEVIRD